MNKQNILHQLSWEKTLYKAEIREIVQEAAMVQSKSSGLEGRENLQETLPNYIQIRVSSCYAGLPTTVILARDSRINLTVILGYLATETIILASKLLAFSESTRGRSADRLRLLLLIIVSVKPYIYGMKGKRTPVISQDLTKPT